MENTEVNIADIVKIQRKLSVKRTSLEDEVAYVSYIKDFDNDYILIETPTTGRVPVSLKPESEIEIAVITADGIWIGTSYIVEVQKQASGGVWITMPEYFEKIQRREFLRITNDFPVKFMYMNGDYVEEELSVKCHNISGGGIALYSKYPIKNRGVMGIDFEYDDLYITTRVKYIHTQYDLTEKLYSTGLQFLEVDRKTADMVHKQVMKRQIEYRKKGLL